MPEENKKFYVTTPIYYSNRPPHLGSAYTTLAADILARYHRLKGEKVFFLTGLDEHGAKMAEAAEEAGKKPQKFCDEMAVKFEQAWKALNISNDGFLRTTDKKHIRAVQKALQELWDNGFIYKGEYQGLYCVGCEQYLTKTDLVDGKCPIHKKKPEVLKEESYFFKLSQFQKELLAKIKNDEFKIEPKERKKEMVSFLEKQKLQDVSISRKKVAWGIKLPFDEKHTAYVWVDAFLSYLTGLGWKGTSDALPKFWPPDVQFMAKDILRVHATIWPGLLLALKIPLPKKLFVHGFFTVNGQKMSKSLGNVMDPVELSEKYGVDAVRYFLFREISFGKDGDVSEERLRERYNSDLANGIGNLTSRVLKMTEQYFDGFVPKMSKEDTEKAKELKLAAKHIRWAGSGLTVESGRDCRLEELVSRIHKRVEGGFSEFRFNFSLGYILGWASLLDAYIEEYKPFELVKKDKYKTGLVIYNLLEGLRHVALMFWPFIPRTADKIFEQLGLVGYSEKILKGKISFEKAKEWGGLKPGIKTKKGESLFPRLNS